jgi:hypothetical protein
MFYSYFKGQQIYIILFKVMYLKIYKYKNSMKIEADPRKINFADFKHGLAPRTKNPHIVFAEFILYTIACQPYELNEVLYP